MFGHFTVVFITVLYTLIFLYSMYHRCSLWFLFSSLNFRILNSLIHFAWSFFSYEELSFFLFGGTGV
jgi:hypothetical protein